MVIITVDQVFHVRSFRNQKKTATVLESCISSWVYVTYREEEEEEETLERRRKKEINIKVSYVLCVKNLRGGKRGEEKGVFGWAMGGARRSQTAREPV